MTCIGLLLSSLTVLHPAGRSYAHRLLWVCVFGAQPLSIRPNAIEPLRNRCNYCSAARRQSCAHKTIDCRRCIQVNKPADAPGAEPPPWRAWRHDGLMHSASGVGASPHLRMGALAGRGGRGLSWLDGPGHHHLLDPPLCLPLLVLHRAWPPPRLWLAWLASFIEQGQTMISRSTSSPSLRLCMHISCDSPCPRIGLAIENTPAETLDSP